MSSAVRFAGGELLVENGALVGVRGRSAKTVDRAVQLCRKFTGREPETLTVEDVPEGTPEVLVVLGELSGLQYASNKFDGKKREYFHETRRPRARLCSNAAGDRLFIVGGKMRVRPEGLVG
ncbi:MAG TPA: hypothetical protein PKI22_08790 [Hydrogenophilus thermoluteolus]|nr:hypothetical protein [Hydrogenophilus thermoluteolus]